MIEVPYWWDRKLTSLASTVYNVRPDLFDIKPQGNAIPLTPPSSKSASNTVTSINKIKFFIVYKYRV